MDSARYSVIRYMPDPGRGERLNIGILLWTTDDRYELRVDDDAVDRVVRENPSLVRDSLLYVAPMIRGRLTDGEGTVSGRVDALLGRQSGFPVDLTEPRFTTLHPVAGLDDAVDALVQRVVRPRRHGGGSGSFNPREAMEKRLKPFFRQGRVERHHAFQAGTGVGRVVDFFANHGTNTALDVLRLAIKKADDIQSRADAEAFKVYDITKQNDIRYVVYCDFSLESHMQETNESARRVIESTGAVVVSEPDEAAAAMIGAAP